MLSGDQTVFEGGQYSLGTRLNSGLHLPRAVVGLSPVPSSHSVAKQLPLDKPRVIGGVRERMWLV